ncbi:branched-chain amino acid ABC transporter permease [Sporomusa termitida]|uniref:High-affinity branched-chain amino acid transport system permease protein LivH n=1 Tax=Sporomusa termitida TaxID=2377 RepID=A0A517DP49_9FIRM|nr:branched-chain amino acid ABC transporter permease [Sporomusa termitida]QDR79145.1 High-affinity branched-chain amino acid transport system permease protein LivH [Sporomusa termitida]
MIMQQVLNGLVIGGVYALTAMGAAMVYGILRILDLASAGAYAIGAYAGLFLYLATDNIVLSFTGAILLTGFFGTAVQKLLYIPMLNRPPIVPLIASIGLFIFIQDLLRLIAGPRIRVFNVQLPFSAWRTENLTVNPTWILIILLAAAFLALLWYILTRTRIGLAWRATAQDLEIAKAMGVNINKVVALNFFLGYSFAAAAGIMVGMLYSSVFPTMGDVPAYKMLALIVLGGLGSPVGTVIAALLIGLIETLVAGYIGFFLPRDAIAFVALIIILLIKPEGLISKKA